MCKPKSHGGLSIKKLNTFNMALLAKQDWRIQQQEQSLLHRLYKARYFPNKSFFESHLGPNPSFAWRGIWKSKQWIEKGCIWHIRDGKRVNVWTDPWIPALEVNPLPPIWAAPDILQAHVKNLLDPFKNSWHMPTIMSYFNPMVATSILKTPLSPSYHEDKLIWREEKNGKFSIHSAY